MRYFQHDTDSKNNRKLRKILRTHGPTGYAIWWAILEELYKSDESGFEIKADELWLESLAESLCISDYRTLIRVFDTFAEVEMISRQHWEEHYLFVESIQERGDKYIQKKTQNAQRQARFREKHKTDPPESSCVTNALRNAKSNEVTLSDPDPDPDPDPKTDPDPGFKRESSCVNAREPESEESPPPPHKKLGNDDQDLISSAFGTIERTPWLKNQDPNMIDDGFVKFIQCRLQGRGAYENRKPSVADAKGYIRAFRAKIRGSEERQHLYLRITDLWQEFCSESDTPEAIEKAVSQEMKRLNINAVLPSSFQERFGVLMCRELNTEQLKQYLTWLKAQSVQGLVCQN